MYTVFLLVLLFRQRFVLFVLFSAPAAAARLTFPLQVGELARYMSTESFEDNNVHTTRKRCRAWRVCAIGKQFPTTTLIYFLVDAEWRSRL